MAEINVKLGGDNSNFRGMIDDSSAAVGKFGRSLEELLPAVSAVAVIGFFKTVIEEAGKLQDLSDRLEVSTDALQSFNYSVKQAGGSSDDATKTWDKARKAIDELASGTPAAVEQFSKLGLSAANFKGLNLEQALELIARGFDENKESAGAYAAVMDILGAKSAPKLMVALDQLAKQGFGGMNAAAKEAGQLMSSEIIGKMDAFGDRLETLKGNAIVIGSIVLGLVQKLADGIGVLVGAFVSLWNGTPAGFKELAAGFKDAEEGAKKMTLATEDASKAMQKQAKESADAYIKQAQDAVELASGLEKINALIELETRLRMQSSSTILDQETKKKFLLEAEKAHMEMLKEQIALGKAGLVIEEKRVEENIKQMDAKDKLIAKAIQQAKAESKVSDEFETQLEAIQKMAGAGKGGFKAGANGGGEGKTTVADLENALENAKRAFEYIQKDPNSKDYAKHYVEAQQAKDEAERNLQKGKNSQGINGDGSVSIDTLEFNNVTINAEKAFGKVDTLTQKLITIAEATGTDIKEIKTTAAKIVENLE